MNSKDKDRGSKHESRDVDRLRERSRSKERTKDRYKREHRSRSRSRSYERKRTRKSRSRSRDRTRERSRSRENRASRSEKEKNRSSRGRGNYASDSNISAQNNKKTTTSDDKSDDIVLDEEALKEIEKFANEEEDDEEKEAQRLLAERKKRREEILKKHGIQNQPQPNEHVHSLVSENNEGPLDDENSRSTVDLFQSNTKPSSADQLAAERDAIEAESMKENNRIFDIFSSSPTDRELLNKTHGMKKAMKSALLEGEDPYLQSNWDDGEGYYKPRIGELIAERYLTRGVVGKGVFSTVLLCQDIKLSSNDEDQNDEINKNKHTVAIKMIRNNDTMRKAAEKEIQLLTEIAAGDPENKKYCVRLFHHFEYRNHVTMVFEPLQMNLRDTIKKFGKKVGINITAVRMYAKQLLIALKHLSDLRIVHADIKPDNILVSEDLKQVKLCDFGSAFRETDTDNDPTPYLISRFYRAPEVILGLNYDRMVDLWSIGVCFYELFTGHVMFPGRTNNDMLKLMMEVKGKFPNKMLRAHLRSYESMSLESHFQEDFRFRQYEQDPVTGKPIVRIVDITQPVKEISAILLSSKAGADDRRMVSALGDLLEKCLHLDPTKRIAVSEALKHSFFASTK